MEGLYKDYLDILRELGKLLDQLTASAKEKIAAVKASDLQALDKCIRHEQALSLSLRGIETKKDTALKEMGLSETTLSTLARHYPEELRTEAQRVTEEVQSKYDVYVTASNAARTTLECALLQVEQVLEQEAEVQSSNGASSPTVGKADIRA